MNYRVDIRYPADEIVRNKRRLESAYQFEFFDRVPVLLGIRSSVSRLHSGCMTSLVATGSTDAC